MTDTTRTLDEGVHRGAVEGGVWTLVLAWVRDEPARTGQSARLTGSHELGRGDDGRLSFARDRPDGRHRAPPLACSALSRRQLAIRVGATGVTVTNHGRRSLSVNGVEQSSAILVENDVIEIDRVLLAVLVRRQPWPAVTPDVLTTAFGAADEHGIVGESLAAWTLRSQLRWCGRRSAPVLITGPSGSGKELAARALHAVSSRASGPFVARNATTLPESLLDAELFGHASDYPQKGMPARPGLVGAAEHGSLFLDEIAELPVQGQAHLLRLLDGDCEYHRLGETRARVADVRIIAATNRPVGELRHDLAPRFLLRIEVPPLSRRIEDVPLLIQSLARQMVRDDPDLAESFPDGSVPVEPEFIRAMLRHRFTHQVRELSTLMWMALGETMERIALTDAVLERLDPPTARPAGRELPSWSEVEAALAAHDGNRTHTAQALGISRYALLRMIKRHR